MVGKTVGLSSFGGTIHCVCGTTFSQCDLWISGRVVHKKGPSSYVDSPPEDPYVQDFKQFNFPALRTIFETCLPATLAAGETAQLGFLIQDGAQIHGDYGLGLVHRRRDLLPEPCHLGRHRGLRLGVDLGIEIRRR